MDVADGGLPQVQDDITHVRCGWTLIHPSASCPCWRAADVEQGSHLAAARLVGVEHGLGEIDVEEVDEVKGAMGEGVQV